MKATKPQQTQGTPVPGQEAAQQEPTAPESTAQELLAQGEPIPAQELSAQGVPIPAQWQRIVAAVWTGQAVSFITSGAAGYALIWYLTETTGSATILALSTIMYFLPVALLGPFAGTIVDRYNRKHIMIVADLGIAAITVIMAFLIIAGFTSVPLILAMIAVRSIGTTFHQPAMQAVMPLLVPDRHLVRINSLDQGIMAISNIGAPALGIFMYAALGLQIALFADAAGALIACGILLLVHIPNVHMATSERTGVLSEMADGFKAVRAVRGMLLFLVFVTLGCVAYMPVASLFPLMTYSHFGGGGYEAALVEAVFGAGFLIGSAVLGFWGGGKRLYLLICFSMIITGITFAACGFLPTSGFIWFVALSGVMAIAGAFFNGPMMALIQRRIEPKKLGRVMALTGSLMSLAAPAGLVVAGPIADQIGIAPWFIICGAALTLISVVALIPQSTRSLDTAPKAPEEVQ
ncbi:MAG: MFS transporter [Coriobacteriales bacterium]|nr:MFS transporter [Coriobacteriales bacterium]